MSVIVGECMCVRERKRPTECVCIRESSTVREREMWSRAKINYRLQ